MRLIELPRIIQLVIYDIIGSFHKESIVEFEKIDIYDLGKNSDVFIFLSVLDKLENKQTLFLKCITETSFAIFFIYFARSRMRIL